MATCPSCKTEQRQRKDGACPKCHTPIMIVDKHWFIEGSGSPITQIIRHFEELASKKLSAGRLFKVPFFLPNKGNRAKLEQVAAKRLLERSDWDLELVKETLTLLFTDRRFSWRTMDSLITIGKGYNMALAITKANRMQAEEEKKKNAEHYNEMLERRNIWA